MLNSRQIFLKARCSHNEKDCASRDPTTEISRGFEVWVGCHVNKLVIQVRLPTSSTPADKPEVVESRDLVLHGRGSVPQFG